jgi:CspA family cold shock protein
LPSQALSKNIAAFEWVRRMLRRIWLHESAFLKMEANMAQGTVKWFNPQKGFGFIQPDDGGKDVFVHISAVEASGLRVLVEGQKVTFDLTTERGKTAATNIKAA